MNALPISRPLVVATVPSDGVVVDVVADEAERAALAKANDVISVDKFEARLTVRPSGRDGFVVIGPLDAAATRTCVVSLEPFVETVSDEIDLTFSPEGGDSTPRAEDDADDPPDQIVGGVIDLGAVASEFFTLALDPYPRKPGATFEKEEDDAGATSPFAALKLLKDRANGGE